MPPRAWLAPVAGVALGVAGCGGTLDAGRDMSHGLLPVDERNPLIIDNDNWADNWIGEYAVLLANSGGPRLAGIIAGTSPYWPNASANATGWGKLVAAARASGLQNIPDVTMSSGAPLARPADGLIESTTPNRSAGAQLIVSLSRQLGTPRRPVVVAVGAPLTNVADAYLIDPTVVDRVVVVAALGEYAAPTATMNGPNGDLDAWAGWIVSQRFRYVQVSTYYDQTADVTEADLSRLPANALGAWMAEKHPDLFTIPQASDQIAVLSVGMPTFATAVERATPDTATSFDSTQGPPLRPAANGNSWIVTQIAAPLAAARLWEMLLDPRTYAP
jgi:hypothetical protein